MDAFKSTTEFWMHSKVLVQSCRYVNPTSRSDWVRTNFHKLPLVYNLHCIKNFFVVTQYMKYLRIFLDFLVVKSATNVSLGGIQRICWVGYCLK